MTQVHIVAGWVDQLDLIVAVGVEAEIKIDNEPTLVTTEYQASVPLADLASLSLPERIAMVAENAHQHYLNDHRQSKENDPFLDPKLPSELAAQVAKSPELVAGISRIEQDIARLRVTPLHFVDDGVRVLISFQGLECEGTIPDDPGAITKNALECWKEYHETYQQEKIQRDRLSEFDVVEVIDQQARPTKRRTSSA